jgi:hypothetical protein
MALNNIEVYRLGQVLAFRNAKLSQRLIAERMQITRGEVCELLRQIKNLDPMSEDFNAVYDSSDDYEIGSTNTSGPSIGDLIRVQMTSSE